MCVLYHTPAIRTIRITSECPEFRNWVNWKFSHYSPLCHLILVAGFTIHDFRSLGGIGGLKSIRAMLSFCVRGVGASVGIDAVLGLLSGAVAFTVVKKWRVNTTHAFFVPAIGAFARDWESEPAQQGQFRRDNAECLLACCALNDLF